MPRHRERIRCRTGAVLWWREGQLRSMLRVMPSPPREPGAGRCDGSRQAARDAAVTGTHRASSSLERSGHRRRDPGWTPSPGTRIRQALPRRITAPLSGRRDHGPPPRPPSRPTCSAPGNRRPPSNPQLHRSATRAQARLVAVAERYGRSGSWAARQQGLGSHRGADLDTGPAPPQNCCRAEDSATRPRGSGCSAIPTDGEGLFSPRPAESDRTHRASAPRRAANP
jgi:hypothetical protein